MVNKNKIFVFFLTVFSIATVFLSFSFFVKYEASVKKENFEQYKTLANFNIPLKAMEKALKADIESAKDRGNVKFTSIIVLLASKYCGNWNEYKEQDMDEIINRLKNDESENVIGQLYKNYSYFKLFYYSLLCEFVGSYKISDEVKEGKNIKFQKKYGLKVYSPIPYGYSISFCDDFDNELNFAKQKGHFGNDIAVKKGTPFVAVESGRISKCTQDKDMCGRIEVKSFDGKRTYCYYNCNKEKPFADGVKKGKVVRGGQILGYVGANDCCKKGGAKILKCPYLHFAIKLKIKSENGAQREVFVDVYNILKFLEHNKAALNRVKDGFSEKYIFKDQIYENNE